MSVFASRSSLIGASRDQRGFSLIVALMMLIVIVILGVSASQMAINEERGARNDRDRQIAFQAAEAAIKDAEQEIYGASSPVCSLPGQVGRGRMRQNTATCFNEDNYYGYAQGCSAPPNAGLCTYVALTAACSASPAGACPAYLDSANVDFYKDATGSGNNHTVPYGLYTGRTFPSQFPSAAPASSASALGTGQPISIYPPRYIIEAVPKNTSVNSLTADGAGGGSGSGQVMFRVTAMGFGANPNSQVVLQAVVATQD